MRAPSARTPQRDAGIRDRLPRFAEPSGGARARRRTTGYLAAIAGTVALAGALLPFRDDITPLSKGFGFLAVVVVAARLGGLGPGVLASVLGFVSFNFLFIPPYGTFVIGRAEDVVILFVFLGLSIVISALLSKATERAEAAEDRGEELRALQSLSAELVSAAPGPDTYRAVLTRLLDLFGFSGGSLLVQDPISRQLIPEVSVGEAGESPPLDGPSAQRLPLAVGGRVIGLLALRADRAPLGPAEGRILRAFCDQLALVLERDRLLRSAADAEAFRQTEHIRRSLLAAVSHDLRSPLAAIKASVTDLLAEDAEHAPADLSEALDSIDRETDRLTSLVTNLLDMSRIEGGVLQARPQVVDLAELVPACVDRLDRERPDVPVRTSIAEDAALVRADPVFLERVLENLLDNAMRASGGAGVELEARRTDDEVAVRIVDHGPGVAPAVRESLFYPFYRLAERGPRLGPGLGLPIAKGFLSLMDGQIWIEDTPGGGATFAFSLPAGTDPA